MGMLYAEYNAMSDINPNDIESIEILKTVPLRLFMVPVRQTALS